MTMHIAQSHSYLNCIFFPCIDISVSYYVPKWTFTQNFIRTDINIWKQHLVTFITNRLPPQTYTERHTYKSVKVVTLQTITLHLNLSEGQIMHYSPPNFLTIASAARRFLRRLTNGPTLPLSRRWSASSMNDIIIGAEVLLSKTIFITQVTNN